MAIHIENENVNLDKGILETAPEQSAYLRAFMVVMRTTRKKHSKGIGKNSADGNDMGSWAKPAHMTGYINRLTAGLLPFKKYK